MITFEEVCGHVVQFVAEQPIENERAGVPVSWRDRLDQVLADIRAELSTANDDEEGAP